MKPTPELTAGFGSRVPQVDLAEIRQSMQQSQPLWRLALSKVVHYFRKSNQ